MKWLLAAWLCAWWWCLGVVLGCFANAWIQRLTGGTWGAPFAAAAVRLAPAVRWLLLGLAPIALGARWLYPWAADRAWLGELARPGFPALWLSQPFFSLRLLAYALAWWALARPATLASKGRSAAALAGHAIVTSLAAVDLLMSLMPGWYSTGFALAALTVQALSGAAFGTWLATRAANAAPSPRDLGNLLLMWCMTWGYLAYMQYLVIWAGDLPREIRWYLPRLTGGWQFYALLLVAVQLALPTAALLFRAVKDRPRRLQAVALMLLVGSMLDAVWTVVPSVAAAGGVP